MRSWDGSKNAINLVSAKAYTAVGGEMAAPVGNITKTATSNTSTVLLDGKEIKLTAYTIDGYNYFKLRDLGSTFDFFVEWDGISNTVMIESMFGYVPENSGDSYSYISKINAGNCVSAINDGTLMVNYARTMYNGHQSNHVIAVNTTDMSPYQFEPVIWDSNKANIPYVSHSFNQSVIFSKKANDFVFANHGDAYGRGFMIDKLRKEMYVDYENTRRGATSSDMNDKTNSPLISLSYYGVIWLTDYTDRNIIAPQVVVGDDRIILLWTEKKESVSKPFYMVLTAEGEVITPPTSLGRLNLNSYETPIYHNGHVFWAYVYNGRVRVVSKAIEK